MSERIASALANSGRSPRELSRDIGVTIARISQLKSGTGGVKAENLFALARATGYSPQWLAEGVGEPRERAGKPAEVLIAHHPALRPREGQNAPLAFDRIWLQDLKLDGCTLRHISFWDSTMEPAVTNGDVLLIDIEQVTPENGGIYLILRADGEAVIKRLLRTMTNGWIIRSDSENKRHYPDEVLPEDEIASLQIAGRVVWRGGIV